MFFAEIEAKKIPGEINDRVKLHTYLSSGDLLVLWNSFKIACTFFSPEAAADTVRTKGISDERSLPWKEDIKESGRYNLTESATDHSLRRRARSPDAA